MDEPNWLLRAVTYHFGGGDALWWGLLLMAIALQGPFWGWRTRHVAAVLVVALLWIVLAGWPSYVGIAALAIFAGAWLVVQHRHPGSHRAGQFAVLVAVVMIAAIAWEYPLIHGASLRIPGRCSMAVVGDSVSAGLNARDVTWPRQLASRTTVRVVDASQQGATLKSAMRQLTAIDGRGDVLVLEIGGNDLLEGLPLRQFAADMEALLAACRQQPFRERIMFELPLPPFCHGYGRTQRDLAARYGFVLLPKREWLAVLTTAGATVDGIHLSDAGQTQLAEVVRRRLGLSAIVNSEPDYERVDRTRSTVPPAPATDSGEPDDRPAVPPRSSS